MTRELAGPQFAYAAEAPPRATSADLSACARELLQRPPANSGPVCVLQPCCPTGSVTFQVVRTDSSYAPDVPWAVPAYISNAQKGDLYLSPGGSMGIIGGLLGALDPAQHYTHMGIFVDDGQSIRHCTLSAEQVGDAIGGAGDLVGKLAMHAAFSELATMPLQYGWPGTVTQTVDVAWRSERDPKSLSDDEKFLDSGVTNKRYAINALGFSPARVGGGALSSQPGGEGYTLEPIVVQPCILTEDPRVRAVLHRVADAASAIRAHYRLYAYSEAQIAFDHDRVWTAMAEATQPDPNDPCTSIPVTETIPAVCSTLPWMAAMIVSKEAKPGVLLDPPSTRGQLRDEGFCVPTYQLSDTLHSGVVDGLYNYTSDDRAKAANALHEQFTEALRKEVAGGITFADLQNEVFYKNPMFKYTRFLMDFVSSIVNALIVDPLVEILDVQERLANIMGNLFAADDPDPGEGWKTPGTGQTVSPDDLATWWQPNSFVSEISCLGLYGNSVPARFRPPHTALRPPQQWRLSEGPGTVAGSVSLQGELRVPRGAVVTVACRSGVANADGLYRIDAPEGDYLMSGHWYDPETTWVWEGQAIVNVPFWATRTLGPNEGEHLELKAPAESRRRITVNVHAETINRHLVGHDWYLPKAAQDNTDFLYLMDASSGAPTPESPEGRYAYNTGGHGYAIEDIGVAAVTYAVNWAQPTDPNDPYAVVFHYYGSMREHDDLKTSKADQVIVPGNGFRDMKIEMFNQEALEAPERAVITLHVTNERLP